VVEVADKLGAAGSVKGEAKGSKEGALAVAVLGLDDADGSLGVLVEVGPGFLEEAEVGESDFAELERGGGGGKDRNDSAGIVGGDGSIARASVVFDEFSGADDDASAASAGGSGFDAQKTLDEGERDSVFLA